MGILVGSNLKKYLMKNTFLAKKVIKNEKNWQKCKFLEKNFRSYGFKNFEANFLQNFKNMKNSSNPEKLRTTEAQKKLLVLLKKYVYLDFEGANNIHVF